MHQPAPPPLTRKRLIDWAGETVVAEADRLVAGGQVLSAAYDPPLVRGAIARGNRPMQTALRILDDGNVESECPCWSNRERGLICAHVIAVALTLVKRATDPKREVKYQAEQRRAARMADVDEGAYIRRATPDTPGALPATLRLTLGADWPQGCLSDRVPLLCEAECRGHIVPLDQVARDQPLALAKQDESILFVLEDISEGPARGQLHVSRFDFMNLLGLLEGRPLHRLDGPPVAVNLPRMSTRVRMDLDRENGELLLIAHTELPFLNPGEFPVYVVAGRTGWVYGADNFWPLENVLPEPYHGIYTEPVVIRRGDVLRFLRTELPALDKVAAIESEITPDLFTIEPERPTFRLAVRGSPASLAATLFARYGKPGTGGVELVAGKPDAREHFGLPDPADLMRYTVRNPGAETEALALLAETGLRGECGDDLESIVDNRNVLNFLGSWLPALRRRGWAVDLEGRVAPYMDDLPFATPIVHINQGHDVNWFDVGFDFEDDRGGSVSQADIEEAIRKGQSFIKRGDRTMLLDTNAIEAMKDVFSDCATGESETAGHFRMADIYAPFVKASLDTLDGVDVEDAPAWRKRADSQNRSMKVEPVAIGDPLESMLRPYQKDGVYWLRFLESNGFGGILADEMGLGKSMQTLAWLRVPRTDPRAKGKPALIVCPSSLVENWAEEAARFTPELKVVPLIGADRHQRWEEVPAADVAVTSYALLRRDVERLAGCEFSAVILDEAQHIKNRSTRNALAAKQLRAPHRIVLTGTPVENGVSDLWSIMDFLMPGYLGPHPVFRENYELPISRGGREAETAQAKLRRKLNPFLVRRLKRDVARDLPPKIQRVSTVSLTTDQRAVYSELLKASQRRISDMVSARGFNRSRMEVLTTLLRLRQVCCHLDLLKLPDLKAKYPSAKLDHFLELLDEALDGGHRLLVFSQFVSMLKILRTELESRNIDYCYLDGSTKNRMDVVHRFNGQREIPAFLISLKAGGTGLNLTGADMVVHFDPWWNPAVEDQATDRAYRIGQKRTVYSIKLITKGTVEEKVLELQKKKRDVINATIESDKQVMQSLKWEDVQELLSL